MSRAEKKQKRSTGVGSRVQGRSRVGCSSLVIEGDHSSGFHPKHHLACVNEFCCCYCCYCGNIGRGREGMEWDGSLWTPHSPRARGQ